MTGIRRTDDNNGNDDDDDVDEVDGDSRQRLADFQTKVPIDIYVYIYIMFPSDKCVSRERHTRICACAGTEERKTRSRP